MNNHDTPVSPPATRVARLLARFEAIEAVQYAVSQAAAAARVASGYTVWEVLESHHVDQIGAIGQELCEQEQQLAAIMEELLAGTNLAAQQHDEQLLTLVTDRIGNMLHRRVAAAAEMLQAAHALFDFANRLSSASRRFRTHSLVSSMLDGLVALSHELNEAIALNGLYQGARTHGADNVRPAMQPQP